MIGPERNEAIACSMMPSEPDVRPFTAYPSVPNLELSTPGLFFLSSNQAMGIRIILPNASCLIFSVWHSPTTAIKYTWKKLKKNWLADINRIIIPYLTES